MRRTILTNGGEPENAESPRRSFECSVCADHKTRSPCGNPCKSGDRAACIRTTFHTAPGSCQIGVCSPDRTPPAGRACRSEEHTSELQSRENLVCRLLL